MSTLMQDVQNPTLRSLVGTASLAAVQRPTSTRPPTLYDALEQALAAVLPDEFDRHDATLDLLHQCALVGAHWDDTVALAPVSVEAHPHGGWVVEVADRTLHLFRLPGAEATFPGGFGVWDVTPLSGPRLPLALRYPQLWAQRRGVA